LLNAKTAQAADHSTIAAGAGNGDHLMSGLKAEVCPRVARSRTPHARPKGRRPWQD
jgi:hypothetical protein